MVKELITVDASWLSGQIQADTTLPREHAVISDNRSLTVSSTYAHVITDAIRTEHQYAEEFANSRFQATHGMSYEDYQKQFGGRKTSIFEDIHEYSFEGQSIGPVAWRSAMFGKVSHLGDLFSPYVHRTYLPLQFLSIMRDLLKSGLTIKADNLLWASRASFQFPSRVREFPFFRVPDELTLEDYTTLFATKTRRWFKYVIDVPIRNIVSYMRHEFCDRYEQFKASDLSDAEKQKFVNDRYGLTLEECDSISNYVANFHSDVTTPNNYHKAAKLFRGITSAKSDSSKHQVMSAVRKVIDYRALDIVDIFFFLGAWGTLRSICAFPERIWGDKIPPEVNAGLLNHIATQLQEVRINAAPGQLYSELTNTLLVVFESLGLPNLPLSRPGFPC